MALSNLSQIELKNMLDELNKKIEQKINKWERQKQEYESRLEQKDIEVLRVLILELSGYRFKLSIKLKKIMSKYEKTIFDLVDEVKL